VAGATLLDREVRWAHVFETVDLTDSLMGGEVMLTTGVPLASGDPGRVDSIVADFAGQRVTAVALELGSIHSRAPETLVTACDRHGMPLVVFDRSVSFVEITRLVAESRLAGDVARLRAAVETRTQLLSASQRGLGSAGLVAALAGALDAQVLLERSDGSVIARAPDHGFDRDFVRALEQWRAREPSPLVSRTIRAPGRAPARLHALLRDGSELDTLAVEEAALALTVSLASEAEPEDVADGDRARLVRRVAEGRIGSAASLFHGARTAGVDLSGAALAAVVVRGGAGPRRLDHLGAPTLVEHAGGGRARMLVAVRGDVRRELPRLLARLAGPDQPASAIGTAFRGDEPWELREALAAADRAALVALATGGGIRNADDLGPLGVVAGAVLAGELTGPLLSDRDRPALEALVAEGLGVAAAARRLGVSRQTLYAKLRRAAARLGCDPLHPDARADLVLRVVCDRMLAAVADGGGQW
jgi:purine catabolism regulator